MSKPHEIDQIFTKPHEIDQKFTKQAPKNYTNHSGHSLTQTQTAATKLQSYTEQKPHEIDQKLMNLHKTTETETTEQQKRSNRNSIPQISIFHALSSTQTHQKPSQKEPPTTPTNNKQLPI